MVHQLGIDNGIQCDLLTPWLVLMMCFVKYIKCVLILGPTFPLREDWVSDCPARRYKVVPSYKPIDAASLTLCRKSSQARSNPGWTTGNTSHCLQQLKPANFENVLSKSQFSGNHRAYLL